MFAFCAAETEYTALGAVDVYAAGKRALEQRDRVMESMEALLVPGYERTPGASPIAAEAIGGAIYSMIFDQVRRGGSESMSEIAPLATYVPRPLHGRRGGLRGGQRRRPRPFAGFVFVGGGPSTGRPCFEIEQRTGPVEGVGEGAARRGSADRASLFHRHCRGRTGSRSPGSSRASITSSPPPP